MPRSHDCLHTVPGHSIVCTCDPSAASLAWPGVQVMMVRNSRSQETELQLLAA